MSRTVATALVTLLVGLGAGQAASAGCMDIDPPLWNTTPTQQVLYDKLVSYMSCPADDPASGALADKVACNYFVGKVLDDAYGIEDFSTGSGTWLLADQMLDYVTHHPDTWSKLGTADDQAALNNAAQGASQGQAVVALMHGDPGHVVLILPGDPQPSGQWNLSVPNSAGFSIGHVDKTYVFCKLSWGFKATDISNVEIWWRVKP